MSDNKTAQDDIERRGRAIRERIDAALDRSGRARGSATLVGITKGRSAPEIAAAVRAGFGVLGESRPQEFREKYSMLADLDLAIEWHFVGRLQPNKVKLVVGYCSLVHSVDDLDLARALSERSRSMDIVTPVLVQVNASGEKSKSGVAPEDAPDLIESIAGMDGLAAKGLMTMAPDAEDPEEVRPVFAATADLARTVEAKLGLPLPELSMGMTGDFEVAVEEGATLVRVGRALFE